MGGWAEVVRESGKAVPSTNSRIASRTLPWSVSNQAVNSGGILRLSIVGVSSVGSWAGIVVDLGFGLEEMDGSPSN